MTHPATARRACGWRLETTLRQNPVTRYQDELSVTKDLLMHLLDSQLAAVTNAISQDNWRPRVVVADATGLGKTVEIRMIMAELIRRGRGEHILMVIQNTSWNSSNRRCGSVLLPR